jgi:hypothetical protein
MNIKKCDNCKYVIICFFNQLSMCNLEIKVTFIFKNYGERMDWQNVYALGKDIIKYNFSERYRIV